MGSMEKVGIAVVGVLILIILIVGWVNRSARDENQNTDDLRRSEASLDGSGRTRLNRDSGDLKVDEDDLLDDEIIDPDPSLNAEDLEDPLTSPILDDDNEIVIDPDVKPQPVDPKPQPAPAIPRRHKVAPGESLSSIAQKYYRRGSAFRVIQDANPGIDPMRMRIGQELIIPPAPPAPTKSKLKPRTQGDRLVDAVPASFIPSSYIKSYATGGTPASVSTKEVLPAGTRGHKVKANDTLGGIAMKYLGSASRANEIVAVNPRLKANPDRLQIGWTIAIPTID